MVGQVTQVISSTRSVACATVGPACDRAAVSGKLMASCPARDLSNVASVIDVVPVVDAV